MNKIILLSLLATISVSLSFSQNISINEGRTIAQNIISERFFALNQNPDLFKISDSYSETFDGTEVFHVYNLSPEGFVIVSASKNTEPVLAFSYESSCSATERHPSVEAFLKSYAEQIAYAIKNDIEATDEIQDNWEHYSKTNFRAREVESVEPFVITKWNQGKYFNTMCPEASGGKDGHVVVGCVATALAQIFNYFRYPTQGTGSYGYDHEDYGHLEVNFAEQTYDYDYMPITPTDYNDNLARLLYNIGVSVDMNYGPNGSGMNNHKGAYTMYTYFGYNDRARYIFKDSTPTIIPEEIESDTVTPDSVWNGILVDHLSRRIPLYYAGWGDYDYESGHAFVFDGYSDSTHYHINWGWGGSYDGFFAINNLSPGGSNFRLAHEVIINAVPANENTPCEELKTINFYEGTLEDGSGPLNEYYANSNCSWLVNMHDSVSGYTLKFEKFDIDETDNVIIYAGNSEESPVITSVFGGDIPDETYTVNSTSFLVKFISDENVSGDGWLISFAPIKPEYCPTNEELTEMSDTICDGSNNWQYMNGEECRWKIEVADTSNFTIEFLELDTEYDKDFVKILRNGRTYVKFSGDTLPEPFSFEAKRITVVFETSSSVRGGGFKLVYRIGETAVESFEIGNISVYPNPANDILTIEGENIAGIQIYDILGRKLIEQNTCDYTTFINTSNLNTGNYIAKIITTDGNSMTKKIEIQK